MPRTLEKHPTDWWLAQRWGNLRIDPSQELPSTIGFGSHKKIRLWCDACGRSTTPMRLREVRARTSCGHCNEKTSAYWLDQQWGDYRLDPAQKLPDYIAPRSTLPMKFICVCGAHFESNLHYLTCKTASVTCHHEKITVKNPRISMDDLCGRKWNRLRIDPEQPFPKRISLRSNKKFWFLCDCGGKTFTQLSYVVGGNSRSCGCYCAEVLRNRKRPLLNIGTTFNYLTVVAIAETDTRQRPQWRCRCSCGEETVVREGDLKSGKVVSCGCAKRGANEFSPVNQIFHYVLGLAPDAVREYRIGTSRRFYDIYVPSVNLAIEFHGLIWHSERFSKDPLRDYHKFLAAQQDHTRLIQIYEDEWRDKRSIVEAFLCALLASRKAQRLKPRYSVIEGRTLSAARSFLKQHHYLGAASGCLTVLAHHPVTDVIVGCWIFMKREPGTVLWHRACTDHQYQMWNPHGAALNLALPILSRMGFNRMLSFSDNRWHNGRLYSNLGFRLVKNIQPNYYYVNNQADRRSKYVFRVQAGTDERTAAALKGWFRLWDSGKKRWELALA